MEATEEEPKSSYQEFDTLFWDCFRDRRGCLRLLEGKVQGPAGTGAERAATLLERRNRPGRRSTD